MEVVHDDLIIIKGDENPIQFFSVSVAMIPLLLYNELYSFNFLPRATVDIVFERNANRKCCDYTRVYSRCATNGSNQEKKKCE